MSFEYELLEQRYRKIRELEELGFTAYPHKYSFTQTLGSILKQYGNAAGEQLAAARSEERRVGKECRL